MAIIIKNILGTPKGTLGNYTYRSRNGKLIKYSLPENHRISHSALAVQGRNTFGLTVRFAKYINSLPSLKQVWKLAQVPGTNNFQKIIKNNAAAVLQSGISADNIITPPGIRLIVKDLSLSSSGIIFHILLYDAELSNLFLTNVNLHIILYSDKPKITGGDEYCFKSMVMEIRECCKESILFKEENEVIGNLINKYHRTVVYIAALSADSDERKIFWTSTYAEKFDNLK
jgi:hypothetical protein